MQIFGKKLTWKRFVGEPALFSLEERIFNSVAIIAFITLFVEVPFNFMIGLWVPASLCLIGLFFSVYLYYISRFKRRSSEAIELFCWVTNILFIINFFYNSGTKGPNVLLFVLTFLLVITIVPKNRVRFWVIVNILAVVVTLGVDYLYPQLAPENYTSALGKSIDFVVTYLVTVALMYFSISYIRKNYDLERSLVIDKNNSIEEQKVELERLNTEKDKLFSIVSHDIKLPLNSIQNYLGILNEMELGREERVEVEKHLLEITRNTSEMLMNVLSWSQSQMKGSYTQLTTVEVADTLKKTLGIEKNMANAKGIDLEVSISPELKIVADPNMFQLVVRNLVSNAIKFTRVGGLIKLIAEEKNGVCLIEISDNGLGIDEAQQKKLFKLTANSTFGTKQEKGIGLGLLLCKEYTELQGGTIRFSSELGVGTSFYLTFKIAEVFNKADE